MTHQLCIAGHRDNPPTDSASGITGPAALFPENFGGWLHDILDPQPQAGPPHTHTFDVPPTEHDENDKPLPSRIEPTMTITRMRQEPLPACAVPHVSDRPQLHPLLLDRDIDRSMARAT